MHIILIVALLLGGGTSFAAQSSLPGDTLYPIKVSVNESVRSFVSFSAEGKASVQAGHALNRLEEAEELAASGSLSADARAQIKENFKLHADRVRERIAAFEADGNFAAAANVSSEFEASLRAHQAILARLEAEHTDLRADIEDVLGVVRVEISANAQTRTRAEAKVTASAGAETESAARGALTASENKIAEVRKYVEANGAKFNAEARAAADARIVSAADLVVQGKAKIDAKAYGEAFLLFKQAERKAQEAKLVLTSDARLKIDLGGVLNVETRGETNGNATRSNDASIKTDAGVKTEGAGTKTDGSIKVDIDL